MRQITTIIMLVISMNALMAQGTLKDYQRAEKFLHFNIHKLVKNLEVRPNWISKTSDFWFKNETGKGFQYLLVNAKSGNNKPAFNHIKVANVLSKKLNKKIKADSLPFTWFEFNEKRNSIKFDLDTSKFKINLKTYLLTELSKTKKKTKKNESISPDGKWIVYIKDFNLHLKSIETKKESVLTTDGILKHDYAAPVSWYKLVDESKDDIFDPSIEISWAPDSKKFVCYKLDRRNTGKLFMYQSLPDSGYRAKVWSYERSLPGEENVSTKEYYIFDIEKNSKIKIDIRPVTDMINWYMPEWINKGTKLSLAVFERGYKEYRLYFVDAITGKVTNPVSETSKTMVEYQMVGYEVINEAKKVIWQSERDGWSHLYLFNAKSGKLINQITKGEYVVRYIASVDAKTETIWFVASGKEKDRDPYYQHLYKVNFDGSGLKLLTPENAEHSIHISPDKQYFVDNFSRVDQKPKSVLRRMKDGKLIKLLQEADITDLLATGWKFPKPFKLKARDGKTDIYGVLFYPSNFDKSKKHPIIDATYSGPQAVRTPKSFNRAYRNADFPFAELGFIVMRIDGLGTALRSKAFHDVSYENLGDIGAPDHIAGLKQLAEKYSYLDLDRVGIYGHSAGGYDAAHALLCYPEFYKVGIASAGNHDIRMSKAWWPEQYMGMPGDHYHKQSNLTLANKLQGKLLLITGDMDNNVNPANTLRFAAELVKNNKDFDLLIIPNKNHGGLYSYPYFIRKRWDYFVKHLMGVKTPKEYLIKIK